VIKFVSDLWHVSSFLWVLITYMLFIWDFQSLLQSVTVEEESRFNCCQIQIENKFFSFFHPQDSYKLEIFKNSRFVNSYCLNKGRYVLELYSLLKGKEPVYILKQPKCPVSIFIIEWVSEWVIVARQQFFGEQHKLIYSVYLWQPIKM
jgi:hypothetical protein